MYRPPRWYGTLDDLSRELVICMVAVDHDSTYGWDAHSRLAAGAGVSTEVAT